MSQNLAAPRKAGTAADEPDVGTNLRAIRRQSGYSLEALAGLSGVSRAMLGQIETGKSVPTVSVVWKIARALGVSASALICPAEIAKSAVLRADDIRVVSSLDGNFCQRFYAAAGSAQTFDVSEVSLAARHHQTLRAEPFGARATLVVTAGSLEVTLAEAAAESLRTGDAFLFQADREHVIANPGNETATAFLVMVPGRNGCR